MSAPWLVSTTLAGSSETLIRDALRSVVEWVDACIVLDTGIADRTLEVAREVAGKKLRVVPCAWNDDFAAARNGALDAARATGARWALTVDTDERIVVAWDESRTRDKATAVRAWLEHDERVTAWLAMDVAGVYPKERFVRLDAPLRWSGRVHEALLWLPGERRELLSRVTFFEVPKTAEEQRAKFERDARVLARLCEEEPSDARWCFYLGETARHLGDPERALEAYDRCVSLEGWNEEAAWACYRAAECVLKSKDYDSTIEWCKRGLRRHTGFAELHWLAGFAAYQAGHPKEAVVWAEAAVAAGEFCGTGRAFKRHGFRFPPGLYEAPFDLLKHAYARLGDDEKARGAARNFELARKRRLEPMQHVKRPA